MYLGNLCGPPRGCGYEDLYYDEDRKKLRVYSEWPCSVDDADTDSDEHDVDYEYAKEALENSLKYYPENRESLKFLERIKDKLL